MFKNYIKIAIRSLFRQKGYSAINILGLSLGVTCFILILLFIQDEMSYDRYHKNADRIYRFREDIAPAERSASMPFSAGPTLRNDFPGMVEHSVRFFNMQAPTLTLDRGPDIRFSENRFFFVDSTVFEVFTFPFVKGDPKTALDEPYSLVLTEPMAKKYFGDEDPMGQTLRFESQHDLKITGVVKPVPQNSHFQFDFLASFSTMTGIQNGQKPRGWFWNPCWTYVLLSEGTDPKALAAHFPDFVQKHFPDNTKHKVTLFLQPLLDIHLHSHLDFEINPNSNIIYIYIFSVIAGFVLLIACINFMNLATARSAKRAREVGMRKVLGAERNQLIRQFLGESFMMSFISVLVALPLTALALPYLNSFFNKSIAFNLQGNNQLLLILTGVVLLVGLLAGIYPAFVLSAFRPIQVLKGKLNLTGFDWTAFMRKGLVIAQFAVSVTLIVGTILAYNQLRFMQNANLGFNKDHVVMVNIFGSRIASKYQEFKDRLLQNSYIREVTTTEDVLGSKFQTFPLTPEGYPEPQQFQRLFVGYDFIETFNLELAAGRSFNREFRTDDTTAVIINEAMVKHLNWGSPEEALSKSFLQGRRRHYVIGVLKDFHYTSLHTPIGPFVLDIANTERVHNFLDRYLAVQIAPENYRETISYLEKMWAEYLPNRPFEYFFMEDDLEKLYRAEENLGRIAGVFSVFAIFVAAIGLLGIASYTAEERTKEIGLRKVLGATVTNIFLNLSKDFLILVGAGILIAWPIAYLLMNSWLAEFAYHMEIGIQPFLLAGLLAFLIAWVTVSYQAVKAALANPIKSLRYE